MRLFTGLDLPPAVVAHLEQFLERLRPTAPIQWSRPSNLHVTTKFIGEWPEDRLEELTGVLATVPPAGEIPVRIRNVGFFPNPHSPRVFWCGIDATGLADLAGATERACAELGIEPESRAFSPHLTLARIKERCDLQPLRETIAALPSLDFGEFQAASFFLYRSQMRAGGSVYTKLAEFALTK